MAKRTLTLDLDTGADDARELEVRVPAWGIVSAHQLRDRSALVARRIAATASARAAG